MPILTFTLKGNQLKSHTVNLHNPLNLRYFKLLHVNHNVTSQHIGIKSHDSATGATPTAAHWEQALLFAKVSFLGTDDVAFYERDSDAEQYVHSVFAIGETASSDKTIEFKDVFKMLSTRPIQVHQPFTIELYALDWSVKTTEYDMGSSTYKVATAHNKLRPVKDIQTGTIADDKFMTFTFEYDEYDTAPRTH